MSNLEGLEDLLAKITTLQQLHHTQGALLLAAAHIKERMMEYPPQRSLTRASIYGKAFQSDRQRKYFFWALRTGKLQVPYRRTMTLAHRWAVRTYNNGLTAEIGNITPYGPGVQGAGTQYRYMRAAGWQTDQAVLDREGPVVLQYVKDGIEQDLAA